MGEWLLIILVVILAFPAGYLIAYLARDELVKGRKYFKVLAGAGILGIILSLIFELEEKIKYSLTLTMIFVIIVSIISIWKSKNEKFMKLKK